MFGEPWAEWPDSKRAEMLEEMAGVVTDNEWSDLVRGLSVKQRCELAYFLTLAVLSPGGLDDGTAGEKEADTFLNAMKHNEIINIALQRYIPSDVARGIVSGIAAGAFIVIGATMRQRLEAYAELRKAEGEPWWGHEPKAENETHPEGRVFPEDLSKLVVGGYYLAISKDRFLCKPVTAIANERIFFGTAVFPAKDFCEEHNIAYFEPLTIWSQNHHA